MIHITDYPCFHEQGYYTPGDTGAPVYRTKAGAIGVAICYDRHYPEYMRALAIGGAELVVVPQAGALDEWPEGLYEGEMQVAAFQNGYFVALCNRVGREECLTFGGESFVCAPDGVVIARAARMEEALLVTEIDLSGGPPLARPPPVHAAPAAGVVRRVGRSPAIRSGVMKSYLRPVALVALAAACSGVNSQSNSFATLAEARQAGAIAQGWIPDGLPPSSHDLREAHLPGTRQRWGIVNFQPAEADSLRAAPDRRRGLPRWTAH